MNERERLCDLDLPSRDELDEEMTAFLEGVKAHYGFLPNFFRVWGTDNRRLRAFLAAYSELMPTDAGIAPLEHEMIALVAAATNGCVYCTLNHGALLRAMTADSELVEHLARDYRAAELTARQRAMLDFTAKLSAEPERIGDDDRQALRRAGFSDEAIWNLSATVCFYASVNRMVRAVGLVPDPEFLANR